MAQVTEIDILFVADPDSSIYALYPGIIVYPHETAEPLCSLRLTYREAITMEDELRLLGFALYKLAHKGRRKEKV